MARSNSLNRREGNLSHREAPKEYDPHIHAANLQEGNALLALDKSAARRCLVDRVELVCDDSGTRELLSCERGLLVGVLLVGEAPSRSVTPRQMVAARAAVRGPLGERAGR